MLFGRTRYRFRREDFADRVKYPKKIWRVSFHAPEGKLYSGSKNNYFIYSTTTLNLSPPLTSTAKIIIMRIDIKALSII